MPTIAAYTGTGTVARLRQFDGTFTSSDMPIISCDGVVRSRTTHGLAWRLDARKGVVYPRTITVWEAGHMGRSKTPASAATARKKIGGPPKRQPKPGEKAAITLRMAPDLKRRLDAAAEGNGRSQSQEAEFRLERSFDRNDLLSEALTLAYGRELAGLLLLLGAALDDAGEVAYGLASTGSDTGSDTADRKGRLAQELRHRYWFNHPYSYDQAVEAVRVILDAARPLGASTPPPGSIAAEPWVTDGNTPGQNRANLLLSLALGIRAPTFEQPDLLKAIQLLGDVAKRIKQKLETAKHE